MEKGKNVTELLGYIGIGLGGAGLLLILLPYICVVTPILSQAAVVIGMLTYVNSHRLEIKKNQWIGLTAMGLGLLGLIIQALLYIGGITASGLW